MYPLFVILLHSLGHECPFAIQVHHNRQQMDLAGESRPTQIQFIIKRRSPIPSGKSALKTTSIKVNLIPRHQVFEEYLNVEIFL